MIYTFYSFKGGVGRSMALANIAEAFHERGLRVVAVDWDLEAPGLESYFTQGRVDGRGGAVTSLASPGLLDLLIEYRSAYPKLQTSRAAAAIVAAAPDPEQYVLQVKEATAQTHELLRKLDSVPEFLREPEPPTDVPVDFEAFIESIYAGDLSPTGEFPEPLAESPLRKYLQCIHPPDGERRNGVYLMSAGAREGVTFGAYAQKVQEFDWTDFYVSCEGRSYFSWLREQLNGIADVTLIDSRTGVTEMGGICTRHLPDAVVSFCAPNYQNVDGVLRVMTGVNNDDVKKARDQRHIDVLVIPTRIDLTESDRLERFSQDFNKKVEEPSGVSERSLFIPDEFTGLVRPLWNLQIPYIPRYNYQEERVLGPDLPPPDAVGEKLVDPYRRIALHLAVLGDPERDGRLREAFAGEIAAQFPQLSGGVPQMAPAGPAAFVGRTSEIQAIKEALLRSFNNPGAFVVVSGPAGIGKSALVAHVCRQLGVSEFPNGVLWASAPDVARPDQAYNWLRSTFGEKQIGERALREKLKARRFLIVVDDVRTAADVRQVFSYGEHCVRVVVTRDPGLSAGASETISVGPLADADVDTLLGIEAGSLLEDAGPGKDVAYQFLHWPLGASLVRREVDRRIAQGQTLDEVRQSLRAAFGRHGILAFDQPGADRGTSVARSLRDVIYGESVPPQVRQVLVSIAKSPDGLVIQDEPQTRSQDISPSRRLSDLGLVTTDSTTGRFRAHPLVRAFLIAEGEIDDAAAPLAPKRHVSSSQDQQDRTNVDVERGKAILRGQAADLDEIQRLGGSLKDSRYFGYARQLFGKARRHSEFRSATQERQLKLTQQHALCTYKDIDLPADQRFGDALAILGDADLNSPKPSQETLGQAGAIYKNMWRLSGRRRDLERSAATYERGYVQGVEGDYGYTGINAAFVHDLLAGQQRQEAPDEAEAHAGQAQAIRKAIVTDLPRIAQQKGKEWLRSEWWYYATMAEACFGLSRHDEARYWLREGLPTKPPDWQLETTTRQLADLAHAQAQPMNPDSSAWRTLRVLVGQAGEALRAITLGKVGLALSGGGFRASFFHIGVLAHLAEVDLLRHVEVLSCVSGGSIVGAHYYLEVRKQLNEKPDREIGRKDYVQIVRRIERDFLEAVQKNLRTRLFASVPANLRTLLDPDYTRTEYLGKLFERHIFARVRDDGRRNLDEMRIAPPDVEQFNPKLDNWRRAAKGPVLLLNATTLNTGHNWQFAVGWMGEPPLGASSPVDRNDVLRRLYYWEAPPQHKKIPLGRAVAASACVPALFDPVEMYGLFPDQIVRLVDGGVHDNQGITGLLEQECTVMLVSDATGQTNLIARPSGEITSVPMRANDILMGRVREAEFRELDLLRRSAAIRGLMFLHLKKDLDVTQLDWVASQDPWSPPDGARLPITSYGIPKTVQRLLAGIRTDLDSFTDQEAYALMLSGYEMAAAELHTALPQWAASREQEDWQFKVIGPVVKRAAGQDFAHAELLRQLGVSGSRSGKIWKLSAPMRWTTGLLMLATLVATAMFVRPSILWSAGRLTLAVAGLYMAATAIAWLTHRLMRTRKSLTVIVTALFMVPLGALGAAIHLAIFDPLFLEKGATDRSRWRGQVIRATATAFTISLAVVLVAWVAGRGGALGRLDVASLIRTSAPAAPGDAGTSPSPEPPAQTITRAREAQAMRDYGAAIPLWTEVLAVAPANVEALTSRAYAYMQRGELEQAATDYSAALAQRREPDWLRARAYAYKLLDRLDESRADLTAVLSIERDEQTLADIRYLDYLQNARRNDSRPPARIYVLLADPLQEVRLDTVKQGLPQPVLVRPPAQSRRPPDVTELRYVYEEDATEAADIARRLGSLGLPVGAVRLVAPGQSRPRHFELWLARDAYTEPGK